MLTALFLLPAVLVALAASACGGSGGAVKGSDAGGGSGGAAILGVAAFKTIATDAIEHETALQAEPGLGFLVRATAGPNWIEVSLGPAYAEYRRDPAARDRLLRDLAAAAGARAERGISQDSLGDVKRYLRPQLKPSSALKKLGAQVARRPFVRNVFLVYAVAREDAFTLVRTRDLERWELRIGELDRIARTNLLEYTDAGERLVCEGEVCGWASGDGYDAARLAVPELRRQIVDEIGPTAYAVPTESVFVAVPERLARRIVQQVQADYANAQNHVSPDVFVERRGKLVPLEG